MKYNSLSKRVENVKKAKQPECKAYFVKDEAEAEKIEAEIDQLPEDIRPKKCIIIIVFGDKDPE